MRERYLDTAKGVGIILMIMGHVGFGGLFDAFIHSFHMPLFFIISGYFIKEEAKLSRIAQRTRKLLGAYVFFCILNIVVSVATGTWDELFVINAVICPTESIAGASWFLPVLLMSEIIVYAEKSLTKNAMLFILYSSLMGLCGLYLIKVHLFSFSIVLLSQWFLAIGVTIRKYRVLDKLNTITGLMMGGLGLILASINGHTNMRIMNYGRYAIIYPIAATLITVCLLIIMREYNISNRFITYIGRKSLVYMGFNQLFILLVNELILINFCPYAPKIVTRVGTLAIVIMLCSGAAIIDDKRNILRRDHL